MHDRKFQNFKYSQRIPRKCMTTNLKNPKAVNFGEILCPLIVASPGGLVLNPLGLTVSLICEMADFFPASNEPSSHACLHGYLAAAARVKYPAACSAANLIPFCLQRGL